MMALREWFHWTNKGTFRIEATTMLGDIVYVLWLGQTYLGTYLCSGTAAASIASGEHDQVLGFNASALTVPADLEAWNGFR